MLVDLSGVFWASLRPAPGLEISVDRQMRRVWANTPDSLQTQPTTQSCWRIHYTAP